MKKLSFLLALLSIFSSAAFAQIGFNNDGSQPDPSAGMDIKFSDKGLLIPRIALVETTSALPVTSPALSLLVYNTVSVNDVTPGYYYWGGSTWIRLSVLSGGSGTTNYVTKWATDGTLGNSQLFDDGTNVGIGTATPGAKLDVAGTVKIADGTQGADKVLTSDANGLASWQESELTELASTPSPNICFSLAGTSMTGDNPLSVAVSGDYAYVANYSDNTMSIFDVSDPASPVQVGIVSTGSDSYPTSVAVSGNYAFITNITSQTMIIFDVSVPASPSEVGSVSTGSGSYPISVAVSGNYAYVTNIVSNTMNIYDVSIPASPSQVGSVSTNDYPNSVAVSGNYAYVANTYSYTMTIYDVSIPASPSQVGSVSTGPDSYPMSVAVSGNYAYVANSNINTMTIYDVSVPASPSEVGSVSTGAGSGPISVAVSGNYAYVTNYNSYTMTIYDVSNPASPSQVGSVNTDDSPISVAVSGNYSYVVNAGSSTIQIFKQGSCPQNILLEDGNVVLVPATWSTSNDNIFNANTGNVGIGTSNPSKKLDISGEMQATGEGSNYFAGNVGIGTSTPLAPLQVTATGTGPTNGLYVYNPANKQSTNASMCARVKSNMGKPYISLDIENVGGWSMGINNSANSLNFSNSWDFNLTYSKMTLLTNGNVGIGTTSPSERLDVAGGNIMTDQQLVSTVADGTAPLAVTSATVIANLNADQLDGKHASEFALASTSANNATYRWATFTTYSDGSTAWACGNNAALFGGVNPSNWTDGNGQAYQMSPDKEVLRTIFTQKGYAKNNAMILNEDCLMYSSTNGKVVMTLFRIKNTTGSIINWTPSFYYSAYSDWNEYASLSLNGANSWSSGSSGSASVTLPIPANRVSTVIFVSTSGPAYTPSSFSIRNCRLAFYNNSLQLPEGLEFIDDLDTATGGWDQ